MNQGKIWLGFKRMVATNWGTKIVSVGIAVLIWVGVLGSRRVEVTKEIALQVKTAPSLVVANDVPQKILFRISGPKAFLKGVLNRPESPILVDLSNAGPGNVTYRLFSDSIHLPIGVKAVSISPQSLSIQLEPEKVIEVPVKLDLRGHLKEGYELESVNITPTVVSVRGPKSKVLDLTEITTRPIYLSSIQGANSELKAEFDPEQLAVEIQEPLPKVSFKLRASSANFKINAVPVKVLSSLKIDIKDPSITIFVRADLETLKSLEPDKIPVQIDLHEMPPGIYLETPKVTLPQGVLLYKTLPEKIRISLH